MNSSETINPTQAAPLVLPGRKAAELLEFIHRRIKLGMLARPSRQEINLELQFSNHTTRRAFEELEVLGFIAPKAPKQH